MKTNILKQAGAFITIVGVHLETEEWILLISIVVTVLGMIQSYLENKQTS